MPTIGFQDGAYTLHLLEGELPATHHLPMLRQPTLVSQIVLTSRHCGFNQGVREFFGECRQGPCPFFNVRAARMRALQHIIIPRIDRFGNLSVGPVSGTISATKGDAVLVIFNAIPVPAHRATALRILCEHQGGPTGRYRLSAYLGDNLVNQETYTWNVWRSGPSPSRLVEEFIAESEAFQPG